MSSSVFVPGRRLILGVVGDLQVVTTSPVVDPSVSPGVAAPINSMYVGAGLYTKFGAGDTDWSLTGAGTAAQTTYPRLANGFPGNNNITTAFAPSNTSLYAYQYGKAGKVLNNVTVRWELTTTGAGLTWAEFGIFRGVPVQGGPSLLTRLGFASITTNATAALGLKSNAIALSTPAKAQDDLWLVVGQLAVTTAFAMRATSITDRTQSFYLTDPTGSLRPSTMAANTSMAQGTNQAPVWAALWDS